WVREPAFADAAVIVNEFGETGIDHLLVETQTGEAALLPSGCLCCQLRGDLTATIEDLLRRRDNGRAPRFRRLVIETSGLAEPAPILGALFAHPYIPLRFP